MKKRIIVFFGVVLAGVVGAWFWFFWTPLGAIVHGENFEGIICDAEKCGADAQYVETAWVSGRQTIITLEEEFSAWIKTNPEKAAQIIFSDLHLYRRRYAGVLVDGRQLIKVQFYHPRFTERQQWLKKVFWTVGSSDRVFHVAYNADNRTFADFGQNASKKVDDGWQISPPYFSVEAFPSMLPMEKSK